MYVDLIHERVKLYVEQSPIGQRFTLAQVREFGNIPSYHWGDVKYMLNRLCDQGIISRYCYDYFHGYDKPCHVYRIEKKLSARKQEVPTHTNINIHYANVPCSFSFQLPAKAKTLQDFDNEQLIQELKRRIA
jgi:hypothetical protein